MASCDAQRTRLLGAHTRSRLSLFAHREHQAVFDVTAAACTTPRNWPQTVGRLNRFFLTPGDANVATDNHDLGKWSVVRPGRCTARQWDRCGHSSTTRPAPRSTSQRATTVPRPPRPPVRRGRRPWRDHRMPFGIHRSWRATCRSTRSPRHAITSSWRDHPGIPRVWRPARPRSCDVQTIRWCDVRASKAKAPAIQPFR